MWILYIFSGIVGAAVLGLAALWVVGERGNLRGLPSTRRAMGSGRGGKQSERSPESRAVPRTYNGIGDLFHAYIYGRWTKEYIGVARRWMPHMSERVKQAWADHYHGKVLPLELAEAVITIDRDIERCDLEQIIPYPTARDIVLRNPVDVVVYDCPCRGSVADPCEPRQVCMLIGGGDFTLDHHPDKSRRISTEEALELLRAEHERGHVHTAYFKDVVDNRFYAICNCCTCCCGGIEAMRDHDVPMVSASGFVAQVDEVMCAGCGTCEEVCPFDAISVNGTSSVEFEACMGCGVCVDQCPDEVIELVRDERKGIPLDVRVIGQPEQVEIS